MKQITCAGLAILMFYAFTLCGCAKRVTTIEAEIVNTNDYNLEEVFIQIVAWNPENEKDGMTASTMVDIQGRTFGIEYNSEFLELEIPSSGQFEYEIEKLEPGRYVIALQRLMPNQKPVGYWGPGPYLGRLLATEDNKPIVLDISEKDKSPFSLDLGKVFISSKDDSFLIHVTFDGFVYVKP